MLMTLADTGRGLAAQLPLQRGNALVGDTGYTVQEQKT
jgi:hypothetical protein